MREQGATVYDARRPSPSGQSSAAPGRWARGDDDTAYLTLVGRLLQVNKAAAEAGHGAGRRDRQSDRGDHHPLKLLQFGVCPPRRQARGVTSYRGFMAKRCEICDKGPVVGRTVSHAHNVGPRRFEPNLQTVRALINGAVAPHSRLHALPARRAKSPRPHRPVPLEPARDVAAPQRGVVARRAQGHGRLLAGDPRRQPALRLRPDPDRPGDAAPCSTATSPRRPSR